MQEEKRMGNFAVSLKRLVEKVSLEVIYTPCDLDKISVEIAGSTVPVCFWPATTIISISCAYRSWALRR